MAAISANNSSRISLIGKSDAIRSIEIHNRKVSSQTTTDIRTSVEEGRTQMLQRMYKLSESYLTRK
jgi:queuine/archaeosine tRNA-ribosyltransferase